MHRPGGTFTSGTLAGWSTGGPSSEYVAFTSTSSNQNVTNLSASGTGVTPTISTWKEGYTGNSVFISNQLIAENFLSIAPTDPLMYYNGGNLLNPKISSANANTAKLKSSLFGNVVADLVTDVGVQVATWKNTQKAHDTVLANLKDQRDQLSGVNLDEEAANLLKYQQLYSASTKILQTGNQMFNTLLAIMN